MRMPFLLAFIALLYVVLLRTNERTNILGLVFRSLLSTDGMHQGGKVRQWMRHSRPSRLRRIVPGIRFAIMWSEKWIWVSSLSALANGTTCLDRTSTMMHELQGVKLSTLTGHLPTLTALIQVPLRGICELSLNSQWEIDTWVSSAEPTGWVAQLIGVPLRYYSSQSSCLPVDLCTYVQYMWQTNHANEETMERKITHDNFNSNESEEQLEYMARLITLLLGPWPQFWI